MKSFTVSFFRVATAAIGLASGAHAASLVPSFENGLTGWTTGGDVSTGLHSGRHVAVVTTAHSSLEDGVDAINLSGSDPLVGGGELEDFVGITVGGLDRDILDQAMEGSALKLGMTVAAGDVLTFEWNLLSHDSLGLDYAFFMVNGVVVNTFSSALAVNVASGAFGNETGFTSMSYQFTSSGPVEIAFGVVDMTDYVGTSTLMLGNVAIPEPSAALLGALGIIPLLRRRRA
ncbi:MAG: PEP-CTERM sorting domain-containing protein [Verrucomicrobiaceae bacterium]|nr:MAG: PEP-CTERM sorting domain-containing protein [Verrucomicrobiaceae bacterium]